jgi:hypothetical protein
MKQHTMQAAHGDMISINSSVCRFKADSDIDHNSPLRTCLIAYGLQVDDFRKFKLWRQAARNGFEANDGRKVTHSTV